jgi:hypothetical protein
MNRRSALLPIDDLPDIANVLLPAYDALPSECATKLLTFCNSDEPHLAKRTPARSETQSEVHSECDGVRRRRVYRPIETDWQVCLNEVSFEEAVLIPNGPAVVHQGVNPQSELFTSNASRAPAPQPCPKFHTRPG